jgi:hypothetical protein
MAMWLARSVLVIVVYVLDSFTVGPEKTPLNDVSLPVTSHY